MQSANAVNSNFTKEGLLYTIQFLMKEKDLIQFIIKKPLAQVKFEHTFTFDSIRKTHYIFSFCNNIGEVYDIIKKKIVSKEIDLKEEPGKLILLLIFNLDYLPVQSPIAIPKIEGEANVNEIIEDLADVIVKLNERVEQLESKTLNSSLFQHSTIVKREDDDLLNIWLDGKRFQLDIKLLYKATVDGFDLKTFHSKCDNQGPTIIFVKSTQGLKFGGYTTSSWDQNKCYKTDSEAFLFSLSTKTMFKVKKKEEATYGTPDYGPTFGKGYDLCIADRCHTTFDSYSIITSYDSGQVENNKKSFLSVSEHFSVKDYEVFQIKIAKQKVVNI